MEVGILGGTGPAGRGLAARLASVGVKVVVGSRSAGRAKEICEELRARWPDRDLPLLPAENAEAADSPLVVVATPWDAAAATAAAHAGHLAGKVVVSMANALVREGKEFHAVIPPEGSVAQGVQLAVPDALVTAAFHHLPARVLADLTSDPDGDVLVCANDKAAADATIELVRTMPNLRPLHAGSLTNAGAVEAFTAVVLGINARYKAHATVRLVGID